MKSFGKKPGLQKVPSAVGKTPNVAGDRIPILRAPRLRSLATRNYGKAPTVPMPTENPSGFGGSIGFGRTGLTGET